MAEEKKLYYCRKCMKNLPGNKFYDSVDSGLIDSNGMLSVCKKCIQSLYDLFYKETGSIEKTIHKVCTNLNIKFSNDAASATRAHITTLIESGKNVNAVFGIYKAKLISVNKSMDKSAEQDLTYTDVGTIFVDKSFDIEDSPISQDVISFWEKDLDKNSDEFKDDILFLEEEFKNFKATYLASTYAEITLLKLVCFGLLNIKKLRIRGEPTEKEVKEIQALMKSLEISPNAKSLAKGNSSDEGVLGLWIFDIENYEPCEWRKKDPRGDMYRDVENVEEYFQKYIVRPLKNFILSSKDFNIDENVENDEELDLTNEEESNFELISNKTEEEEE